MSEKDPELDRIRWAARRGMLELDLVFKPYIEHYYLKATEIEKEAFHRLLALEDQTLFDWLIKLKPVDNEHKKMTEIILKVKKSSF